MDELEQRLRLEKKQDVEDRFYAVFPALVEAVCAIYMSLHPEIDYVHDDGTIDCIVMAITGFFIIPILILANLCNRTNNAKLFLPMIALVAVSFFQMMGQMMTKCDWLVYINVVGIVLFILVAIESKNEGHKGLMWFCTLSVAPIVVWIIGWFGWIGYEVKFVGMLVTEAVAMLCLALFGWREKVLKRKMSIDDLVE